MLTQEQVLEMVKAGRKSNCLDGRDYARLIDFFPVSEWEHFGAKLREGAEPPTLRPWTREEVVKQLTDDVEFGFEKALGRRGLSAGFMYETVKMWMWVLEDELAEFSDDEYAQYGLPLFKAVALKYGLPNEIGNDNGDEYKYSADADWDED